MVCVMSMAPDTTKGQEERFVGSWSCPSLAATLGRVGPAPLLGSTVNLILLTGVWVS